jgi:hypothetical protein
MCALSPRNRWDRNLRDTITVLDAAANDRGTEGLKCGTFRKNVDKAYRIAKTGDQSNLKGRKVESFLSNILDQDSSKVTVDVWAWRIAQGDIKRNPESISEKEYGEADTAYQTVAAETGESPYVVQAVTWVTARRYSKMKVSIDQPGLF